jgi:hypothetical protein
MRAVAGALAAALLVAAASGAAGALINGYERHGADFCDCPATEQAVCGTDQQTYLNECVMSCINAIKLKDGPCDPTCYPPRNQFDGGDWSSRQPVCASGITYTNKAEAQVGGATPGGQQGVSGLPHEHRSRGGGAVGCGSGGCVPPVGGGASVGSRPAARNPASQHAAAGSHRA